MTREQPAAPAQPSPEAAAPEDWAAERAALARLFPHAADQIVPRARAAMARAIEREDAAMQVEATAWCARALTALGQADDAARLAHEVLATAVADDPARRAQLLAALGLAYEGLGRYADALDLHQEAHDLLEAHGDERGVASARLSMGCCIRAATITQSASGTTRPRSRPSSVTTMRHPSSACSTTSD